MRAVLLLTHVCMYIYIYAVYRARRARLVTGFYRHWEDNDPDGSIAHKHNYGGFNGGGEATRGGSGGGGGTDVRLRPGDWNSRIIVAGGGGGCGYNGCEDAGGDGGGLKGENSNGRENNKDSFGGTQTAGGKNQCNNAKTFGEFGKGGSFDDENDGGGGGGGWFGGSGACGDNTPGAGGSSYYAKMEVNGYLKTAASANTNGDGNGYIQYRFM